MFTRFTVVLSTLAVLVAAGGIPPNVYECHDGIAQCCGEVYQTDSKQVSDVVLGNFAGVDAGSLSGPLGVHCDLIKGIGGLAPVQCEHYPVCCHGTTADGLVNTDCVPISI